MSSSSNICICIPTYNSEATIRKALTSIINQSYKDMEIHVVDNNSTDNTLKIVGEFSDERLIIHKNKKTIPSGDNHNLCTSFSKGKYTAIFHSDDIYHKDMLSKQIHFMEEHNDVGVAFTNGCMIDENDQFIGSLNVPSEIPSVCNYNQIISFLLKYSNFMICPSAIVRSKIYNTRNIWNFSKFKLSCDLGAWLKIAESFNIGFIKENLISYRISKFQDSEYTRISIKKADFFLPIEYHLKKNKKKLKLDSDDYKNLKILIIRDYLSRTVNAIIQKKYVQAKSNLSKIIKNKNLPLIFHRKKALFIVFIAVGIKLFTLLNSLFILRPILIYFKKRFNK